MKMNGMETGRCMEQDIRKQEETDKKKFVETFPLISVIVPVYQVKDYLDECIQSLSRQTWRNMEILLIDDGSTDGSSAICDRYAGKDSRLRVFHQGNQGLSGARNEGLRQAKGEYIAFVDSDDLVSPIYIEELYHLIRKYDADISVCDYSVNWETVDREHRNDLKSICLDSERMLMEWHGKRKRVETVVWNKLYRREILLSSVQPALFPEGKLHEDVYVSHQIVQHARRIAVTEEKLYMYRQRESSIKNSGITEEGVRQNLDAQAARLDFFYHRGMKGSCRRLAVGYLLHVLMFGWKLMRAGKIGIKISNELSYLWKVII